MSKKRHRSIKTRTVIIIIISLIIGVITYLTAYTIGDYIIMRTTQSDQREMALVTEFQDYVSKNKIESNQKRKIQQWCKEKGNVYCIIFESEYVQVLIDSENILEYKSSDINYYGDLETYDIEFENGKSKVSFVKYGEDAIFTIIQISSLVLAFMVSICIILIYLSKLTKRISDISNEASYVSFDINHTIEIKNEHNDEIDDLYINIENMRKDIIKYYENKQKAEEANKELITNMSHDIRTPLTSIIGYNEMMLSESCSEDDMKQYAKYSLEKAIQLKEMSDRLFEYSLVYMTNSIKVNKEEYNAQLLIDQLLCEQIMIIKQSGYSVDLKYNLGDEIIKTDALILKRVIDNLFSNLSKYAKNNSTIKITVSKDEKGIIIRFENEVKDKINESQSTKIGLRSCDKLMEELGGSIIYGQNSNTFITVLKIKD